MSSSVQALANQSQSRAGVKTYTLFDLRDHPVLSRIKKGDRPVANIKNGTETLRSIRHSLTHVIDLNKAGLSNKGQIWNDLYGFAFIKECHCFPALSRHKQTSNGRLALEQKVTDQAVLLKADNKVPYLISIGSGTLGMEVQIARDLVSQGVTQFKMDLIDTGYRDNPELSYSGIEDRFKPQFMEEFVELLTTGLAARITLGAKRSESCSLMTLHAQKAIDKNKVPTEADIEIRFFSSVQDYKANISKASAKKSNSRANIIYDVDLCHDLQEKNSIVTEVLNLSDKNASYLSCNLYSGESTVIADIETRTRTDGNWGKSIFESV